MYRGANDLKHNIGPLPESDEKLFNTILTRQNSINYQI